MRLCFNYPGGNVCAFLALFVGIHGLFAEIHIPNHVEIAHNVLYHPTLCAQQKHALDGYDKH